MNNGVDPLEFLRMLRGFRPDKDTVTRILALYSAAIAIADERIQKRTIELGRECSVGRRQFDEILLQSYLFLGFPRMLAAAESLAEFFPGSQRHSPLQQIRSDESAAWFNDGMALCRRVYGDRFEPLKTRVEALVPDIFRWMIIEGYGKVLSRPGVSIVDRELAIVSCLMVENREKQLFSHMKGAINVGADPELVKTVLDDLGPAVGKGYEAALAIFQRLGTG